MARKERGGKGRAPVERDEQGGPAPDAAEVAEVAAATSLRVSLFDDVDEASSPDGGSAARVPWRRLLAGGTPREVLARIVDGDPLGVRPRVAQRLRSRALLLDADRVVLHVLARCAREAPLYRGRPALEAWLDAILEAGLDELLREDVESERAARPATPEELAAHRELARPLGLDPEEMRGVCVAFNHLDEGDRRAFYALVLEGASLDALARETGRAAPVLARAARRALEAILLRTRDGAPPGSASR